MLPAVAAVSNPQIESPAPCGVVAVNAAAAVITSPGTKLPTKKMFSPIVAKKTMPANSLQDLIAWLRANPDKASQGTAGAGSTSHLSGVFFQNGQYWTSSYYIGIGTILLIAAAVRRVREWRVRLLAAVAFLCLVLAWGDATERYKGVDKVIHALQNVAPDRAIRYVVAGTGDDLPRLREQA